MVRENSEAWHTDPKQIYLCGFSAGGHLCASLGTLWKDGMFAVGTGYEPYQWKPDGMILSYPVISMDQFGHEECRTLLLGERQQELKGAAVPAEAGEPGYRACFPLVHPGG